MKVLYFLEGLRTPWLDQLMLFLTAFGGEIIFLMIALIVFWCVDKKKGYYILAVGFVGTLANQMLKLSCQIPRPWVLDPNFTTVEAARADAGGYSFPSGHTQNAVGTFGVLAVTSKNKWFRRLCIALAVLIPFSRMYLGVHTPLDVGVAAGMALVILAVLHPVIDSKKAWAFPALLGILAVCNLICILVVELMLSRQGMDPENYAEGAKNVYSLFGALLGLVIAYEADERKFQFPTQASLPCQVLKVLLGACFIMALRMGLKVPLKLLFQGHVAANGLRYFLMVLAAGIVWPLTFPWFQKQQWGRKK